MNLYIYPSLYNQGPTYPNTHDEITFYVIKSKKGTGVPFPTNIDEANN